MNKDLKKFDVLLVNLDPGKGHVQAGLRPVILIQSNLFNRNSSTLIIVPLTSTEKTLFPSEFLIQPSETNGLMAASRFLGSQMMTVDRCWVLKKMGHLEEVYHPLVQEALSVALDWEGDF